MALFTGIRLTEEQVRAYVVERNMPTGGNPGQSTPPDQMVLDSLLDPEQSVVFRRKYSNIFS